MIGQDEVNISRIVEKRLTDDALQNIEDLIVHVLQELYGGA